MISVVEEGGGGGVIQENTLGRNRSKESDGVSPSQTPDVGSRKRFSRNSESAA